MTSPASRTAAAASRPSSPPQPSLPASSPTAGASRTPSEPPGPWADLARPPLRTAALRGGLVAPAGPLARLEVERRLGSTSTTLAERATADPAAWPHLSVLLAEHQDAGRGRRGRAFATAPRAALTFSVLLRTPAGSAPHLPWLPLLAGLAVVQVLRRRAGVQAVLKWPNDVLLPPPPAGSGGAGVHAAPPPAKVCGLLAEVLPPSVPDDSAAEVGSGAGGLAVVLGVGLNVDASVEELPPGATSLRLAGAATTDRDTLLRALLRRLADLWADWRALPPGPGPGDPSGGPAPPGAALAGLTDPVREVCATLGQDVRVLLPGGEVVAGRAESLAADGALVVRTPSGTRTLLAGDVEHVRPHAGPS
ncbi:biotin--[acetyl-CoA-carboxylase] ligase [Pseudokineococcus sp. 1T1Z-3]|uniref:biotin--[acetyl-CoA-carboxylase] ligase n=1 Tax=Pseudokineococcus sp. 1T1Z-3 TaxID=3132745 RepID=UPI0030B76E3E